MISKFGHDKERIEEFVRLCASMALCKSKTQVLTKINHILFRIGGIADFNERRRLLHVAHEELFTLRRDIGFYVGDPDIGFYVGDPNDDQGEQ